MPNRNFKHKHNLAKCDRSNIFYFEFRFSENVNDLIINISVVVLALVLALRPNFMV